jgi:phosphohistidine phosphatase
VNLYLVQHGEAKTEAEDPERALTQFGTEVVERMAAWAAKAGIEVDQVRHSGKRRAQQTAEILAHGIVSSQGVVSVSGLNPNDEVVPWAEELAKETESVMLVGHLPFLSRLANLLLVGDPTKGIIRFRNAGIVCLIREESKWSVRWVVTPRQVEGLI